MEMLRAKQEEQESLSFAQLRLTEFKLQHHSQIKVASTVRAKTMLKVKVLS